MRKLILAAVMPGAAADYHEAATSDRRHGTVALTPAQALAWAAGIATLFAMGLLASLLLIVPEPTSYLG